MKKNTGILVVALFVLLLIDLNAQAQDTAKTSVTPLSLKLWGYADVYYAYDFNNPVSKNRAELVNGNTFVVSHNRSNEFALNNGIIGLQYTKNRVRGAFSYQTGSYVKANYAAEPSILQNIYEAYAGYELKKNLWVYAGIFTSHIGPESAISMDNLTLSRSIMADNTPYYETGVKLTYSPNNKLTLTALVLNGWQNIVDRNRNKAVGTQVQWKPASNVLLNSSTFIGKEPGAYENTTNFISTDSLSTERFFHDFYTQIDITKKLTLLFAFDAGMQKRRLAGGYNYWYSQNLIVNYTFTSKLSAAIRSEYYHDKYGVIIYSGTSNGFQTYAPSLNIDFKLTENMVWRVEGRVFDSRDKVFVKNGHATTTDTFVLTSLTVKFK